MQNKSNESWNLLWKIARAKVRHLRLETIGNSFSIPFAQINQFYWMSAFALFFGKFRKVKLLKFLATEPILGISGILTFSLVSKIYLFRFGEKSARNVKYCNAKMDGGGGGIRIVVFAGTLPHLRVECECDRRPNDKSDTAHAAMN